MNPAWKRATIAATNAENAREQAMISSNDSFNDSVNGVQATKESGLSPDAELNRLTPDNSIMNCTAGCEFTFEHSAGKSR